jgi:hypothetical protein
MFILLSLASPPARADALLPSGSPLLPRRLFLPVKEGAVLSLRARRGSGGGIVKTTGTRCEEKDATVGFEFEDVERSAL